VGRESEMEGDILVKTMKMRKYGGIKIVCDDIT